MRVIIFGNNLIWFRLKQQLIVEYKYLELMILQKKSVTDADILISTDTDRGPVASCPVQLAIMLDENYWFQ